MPKDRSYEATGRKKHDFGRGSRWCKRCGIIQLLFKNMT